MDPPHGTPQVILATPLASEDTLEETLEEISAGGPDPPCPRMVVVLLLLVPHLVLASFSVCLADVHQLEAAKIMNATPVVDG